MSPPSATTIEISPADLRAAMARFATGVTVITSVVEGRPVGTTASAVTSLSLDPPLVLVCLDRRSRTLAAVRTHGAFAVNVLAAHHEPLSNAFAISGNDDAWGEVATAPGATGSPLLGDAHVALDCTVEQITEGGDHEIVIGRVIDARHGAGDAAPLLYYGGRYAGLAGAGGAARLGLKQDQNDKETL